MREEIKSYEEIIKYSTCEPIIDNAVDLVTMLNCILINQGCLGLAAPQIGINKALFSVKFDNFTVREFINPKIIDSLGTQVMIDGCVSVKDKRGLVLRPKEIVLCYDTLDSKGNIARFKGFWAGIISHEVDHLNGVIYTSKTLCKLVNKNSILGVMKLRILKVLYTLKYAIGL